MSKVYKSRESPVCFLFKLLFVYPLAVRWAFPANSQVFSRCREWWLLLVVALGSLISVVVELGL